MSLSRYIYFLPYKKTTSKLLRSGKTVTVFTGAEALEASTNFTPLKLYYTYPIYGNSPNKVKIIDDLGETQSITLNTKVLDHFDSTWKRASYATVSKARQGLNKMTVQFETQESESNDLKKEPTDG